MGFQIEPLRAEAFRPLFMMTDTELAARKARRMIVTSHPGTPCRVSLTDADIGETVILTHFNHQAADSPFHASHAVFIRKGAKTANVPPNAVPQVLRSRLISVRLFDAEDMMIDADVVEGATLGKHLTQTFENAQVAYVHLHYAKPGCFAALARRIPGRRSA